MNDPDKTWDGQTVNTDLGGNRYVDSPAPGGDRTYLDSAHQPVDPPPCTGGSSSNQNTGDGWW